MSSNKAKLVPAKIVKYGSSGELCLDVIDKPVRVGPHPTVNMTDCISEIPARAFLGQKCYTSTCYFKPKQVPVSYSETLILKIGSNKKRYFESVYCKNTLIPSYWSETMTANLNYGSCKSEISIPRDEQHQYVALDPQVDPMDKLMFQVCALTGKHTKM